MANDFDKAYAEYSKTTGMNPNPDDPKHFYDYRQLYKDTGSITPDEGGHLPSEYKTEGHPRTIVDGINTKTGLPQKAPGLYSSLEKEQFTNGDLWNTAATIYGEVGSLDEDAWNMASSTVFNRRGVREWRNKPVGQILNEGYYANQNTNVPFKQAMSGKFDNKDDEGRFKRILAIVSGMQKGSIKLEDGQFFFKDGEALGLRKKLKKGRRVGDYTVYSY